MFPNASQASYSASKAAARSYSLAVGQELRLQGFRKVKVLVVEPWAVDTPFWKHAANYSGKLPKFALMDEPQKVVNNLVSKSIRPRKIVPVGGKAKIASFFANVFPRGIESITANIAHRYKIGMDPEAEDGPGILYEEKSGESKREGDILEILKNSGNNR